LDKYAYYWQEGRLNSNWEGTNASKIQAYVGILICVGLIGALEMSLLSRKCCCKTSDDSL